MGTAMAEVFFPFTSDSSRTFHCGGFLILEPLLWMHLCFLSDMILRPSRRAIADEK